MPAPFRVSAPDRALDDIRARVAAFPWHEAPDGGGWVHGADLDYMKALAEHWLDSYDWRAAEAALNRFPQFTARVDGLDLHYIHLRGSGPDPTPLLISHGWPGSVFEFMEVLEPLAHPERFGGRAEDSFDVVAPSLPGYGWSGKPPRPIGPRAVAGMFAKLMAEVLGYRRFLAQGGDWGAAIASWIGFEHAPPCAGIHLNMMGVRAAGVAPRSDEEKAWAREARRIFDAGGAYLRQHATKPQTLSYAMMDSPVGVAAWIIEKFYAWSDLRRRGLNAVYSKDRLLDNVMVYLLTRSFNTATWIYYGHRESGDGFLPPGGRVEAPVGVAAFPVEFVLWPPRSYAETAYNIVHWTDMPRGGHFAAMEEPEALVADIRAFARPLRTDSGRRNPPPGP